MDNRGIFRVLLVVVLLVGLSLSCNFISNVKETFELKNTAEAFITDIDIEGLVTEIDMEAMITEIDMKAIETEMGTIATDFDFEAIVTEFDGGELLGTAELQIPGMVGERPPDIPVLQEGTEIVESSNLVEYYIDASIGEVVTFYEREMPVNGWVKTEDDKSDDYATLVYTKGGRKATIEVISFFGEVSVSIIITGD